MRGALFSGACPAVGLGGGAMMTTAAI